MIVHQGSKDLVDKVAILKNELTLPFSKELKWNRFGWLGIMADFLVSQTSGNILEIGVGESSIYLSFIAKKYNRKVYHCDIQPDQFKNMSSVPGFFNDDAILYAGTSDDFFKEIKFDTLSFAFLDGDHMYETVRRDFYNTLKYLASDGFIVLHDSFPPNDGWKIETKCGTVYKLREELEQSDQFDIFTFKKSAWDVGLSIVQRRYLNG